jgi:hypothetical protein
METTMTYSPITGQQIPVSEEIAKKLNVKPLIYMGKEIRTPSGVVMNDRWIFVRMPGHGERAINVNRANYCQKMYLSQITIKESIGDNKLMDDDLQKFVEKVSDKIVFEKYGRWYRVFLTKKTRRTFEIKKVVAYNWTIDPNREFDGIMAHQLCIDWKSKFYVK